MNLPNKLTMLRIALIPLFILFTVGLPDIFTRLFTFIGLGDLMRAFTEFVSDFGLLTAGIIFIIAFITDALDGYIARENYLVTDFGAFLDPIADKLLVTAALVSLAARGLIGAWIPALIISREFIVTGLRMIASNKGIVLAAGAFGKMKTVVQSAALILILFQNFHISFLASINAGSILLYIALLLTLLSGADYIIKNRELFADSK